MLTETFSQLRVVIGPLEKTLAPWPPIGCNERGYLYCSGERSHAEK